MESRAAHPLTGQLFASPVPPGTGWPGDPADASTPVARTSDEVAMLAQQASGVAQLQARISVCRACPRLVQWRESVARDGHRAAFADQPYWGRPAPAFGDPEAEVLLVGLAPAANGTNRTGRLFTGDPSGDFLFAALHRTGWASQPTSVSAGDGQQLRGLRMLASVRCAPPQNKPTRDELSTCAGWLRRDLELAAGHLRAIVCLGVLGWNATMVTLADLGWDVPRPRPKFGHGVGVELHKPASQSVRVIGCYHVSPRNTNTGRLTAQMLDEVLLSVRG